MSPKWRRKLSGSTIWVTLLCFSSVSVVCSLLVLGILGFEGSAEAEAAGCG